MRTDGTGNATYVTVQIRGSRTAIDDTQNI